MKTLQMYIDGQWCDAASGATYEAINPALAEPFGIVVKGSRQDAQRAIAAANDAQRTWRDVPLWDRCAICIKVAEVLDRRKDELADILCTELGKPWKSEAMV